MLCCVSTSSPEEGETPAVDIERLITGPADKDSDLPDLGQVQREVTRALRHRAADADGDDGDPPGRREVGRRARAGAPDRGRGPTVPRRPQGRQRGRDPRGPHQRRLPAPRPRPLPRPRHPRHRRPPQLRRPRPLLPVPPPPRNFARRQCRHCRAWCTCSCNYPDKTSFGAADFCALPL